MKIFFDTEFTGLSKDTTLISIGLVTENEQRFYAEVSNYNDSQVDDWIKKNVIANLSLIAQSRSSIENIVKEESYTYVYTGNMTTLANELSEWFGKFDTVELVSDVCHYDMVLLIDIFGDAFSLPKNVCPACYDINHDIMRHFNCTMNEAFDMNREGILKRYNISIPGITSEMKHNALYDAKVIKALYSFLSSNE